MITKQRSATDDQKAAGANESKLADETPDRRSLDRPEAETASDRLRIATYGHDLRTWQAGTHVVSNAQEQRLVSEITLPIDPENTNYGAGARRFGPARDVASHGRPLISCILHVTSRCAR